MRRVERSAIVPFSCEQMFALVNDVARYPEFVPGCVGAAVLSCDETEMVARLDLSKAKLKQSFVTRNTLHPPNKISLQLHEGPFKSLQGQWKFHALSNTACKVSFCLVFEFSNFILDKTAGKLLERVAGEQVDAMCTRARQLYDAAP